MSALNNAASNALRILGEVVPPSGIDHESLLMRPEEPLFLRTVAAAGILAGIEDTPGFQWNEGRVTDWETACARVARIIEKRHPTRAAILRAVRA